MIIPKPQRLERLAGSFTLTADTELYADEASGPAARMLRDALSPATGFPFRPTSDRASAGIVLTVDADRFQADRLEGGAAGNDGTSAGSSAATSAGGGNAADAGSIPSRADEAYRLTVTPERIEIVGGGPAGVFYGVQSLRQLLPPEVYGRTRVDRVWEVPAVSVDDRPAFGWRGSMLDVGRHFMPKEFVLKFIDLLALHKLNVFHFHLTEDQGWRLAIDKYPRLTEVGAWRDETLIGHGGRPESERTFDGVRHGGFYTKEDIREIVAYAAERFVTVVPEIDMPGHMVAALAAYPELGNGTGPYSVMTTWGISTQVLNVEESTLDFCRDVLAEAAELFPAPFVHTGGDECPRDEWKASPAAQRRIQELGLSGPEELQPWFTRQMAAFLAGKGKRLVGWDEILEGGGPDALPDDVVVMSWRGEAGGVQAAEAGLDVVMSPNSHLYFDYYQADPEREPLAIGGLITLEKVYGYSVVPEGLDEEAASHILGAQCNLWTEYVPTPEHAEYMWAPRACAFADAVWRDPAQPVEPFETFVVDRLRPHLARLDAYGVNYRPLDD